MRRYRRKRTEYGSEGYELSGLSAQEGMGELMHQLSSMLVRSEVPGKQEINIFINPKTGNAEGFAMRRGQLTAEENAKCKAAWDSIDGELEKRGFSRDPALRVEGTATVTFGTAIQRGKKNV